MLTVTTHTATIADLFKAHGVQLQESAYNVLNECPLDSNVGDSCALIINAASIVHNNTADTVETAVNWAMIIDQCITYYTG